MKKILLSMFVCLLSISIHAATTTEGFEDVSIVDADGNPLSSSWAAGYGLSNGWKVVGGNIYASDGVGNYGLWSKAHTGSKSMEASYSATNNAFVVIPTKLMGEFKFWARKTSSSSRTKGTINIWEVNEADGSYVKSSEIASYSLTTTWTEYTVDLGTEGKFVAINMVRAGVDDVTYSTFEEATTPNIAVSFDGNPVKSGFSRDFGIVEKDSSTSFTLSNSGAGTLEATLSATEGYAISADKVSLNAGEDTTVTVTLSAANAGIYKGAVTISAPELEDWTLNLTGVVRDSDKIYINFDSMPEGWTLNDTTYAYDYDGVLIADYWYTAELTSPRIEVGEGETFYFRYQSGTTSSYQTPVVNVFYSENATDWTQVGDNFAADAVNHYWKPAFVEGIPTTAQYIKVSAKYVKLDDFYGFSFPKKAVMKATVADHDFGMIDRDSTFTYIISNEGKKALTGLKAEADDSNFVFTVPQTIEPNASDTLKVTMLATTKGAHKALITISADEQDTVKFNVQGYAIDKDAIFLGFDTDSLPRGWENDGWIIDGGKAYAGYGESESKKLTSPQLVVNEGDELAIRADKEYASGWLKLYASTDRGASWTLAHDYADELKADTMQTVVATLPEGKIMLRFEGSYVNIEAINGLHVDDNAPIMEVVYNDVAVATGETADFGISYEPVARSYEVKNVGTGTLNVKVLSSNDSLFTVSDSALTIGQDESKQFAVTMNAGEPYGKREARIIISSDTDGIDSVEIKVIGEVRDSTLWSDDFENGISEMWTNNGWTIDEPYYGNGTKMAWATATDGTYLITPRLEAKEGEQLIYQALLSWTDEPLTVEYSTDEQQTWTVDSVYAPESDHTLKDMVFTAPADGYYFLRFSGRYNYVDNFYGFKYAKELPTGITSINRQTTSEDGCMYDLSGRRINETDAVRGIYIKNGKKYIRK